jgi:hypothetical protein
MSAALEERDSAGTDISGRAGDSDSHEGIIS